MRVGAGTPGRKRGDRGEESCLGGGGCMGDWASAAQIWVAFSLPHPRKCPRNNFRVRQLREQWFFICCSIKCRFVQDVGVSACRQWLSSELGSLRSCLARGGKVGNPSASITLAGPQHPAGGLPVPRNTSKNQNICKTATIQTSNIYPGFLVALQNPISLEVGFRGWSQSRMSTCHRGAGTPLCCEHPKAEPWRWLMPHVVTVKDMGQGLSLPMWNWIFQP